MASTVEQHRSFSIHDLKRLGILRDGFAGKMNWRDDDGEVVSTIGIQVSLSARRVFLRYSITETGEQIADTVRLRWVKSNLPNQSGGYWVFVCPATEQPCKVLYLDDCHFKSRAALPQGTIYKSQTQPHSFRLLNRYFDGYDRLGAAVEYFEQPYAKEFYGGKPTRKYRLAMDVLDNYKRLRNLPFAQKFLC